MRQLVQLVVRAGVVGLCEKAGVDRIDLAIDEVGDDAPSRLAPAADAGAPSELDVGEELLERSEEDLGLHHFLRFSTCFSRKATRSPARPRCALRKTCRSFAGTFSSAKSSSARACRSVSEREAGLGPATSGVERPRS